MNPLTEDVSRCIDELTGGKGCQIVVEATGNPEVAPQALKVAAQASEAYFGLLREKETYLGVVLDLSKW